MSAVVAVVALLVGLSLGLLGGGGSVLLLPALVYIVGLDAPHAVTLSLLVVACTSVVALISHAMAGAVRWRAGLGFAAASMIGAALGSALSPYIAQTVLMAAFVVLLVITALAMLRPRAQQDIEPLAASAAHASLPPRPLAGLPFVLGISVGIVSGVFGAGGGFLVVPALAKVGGMSMRSAIATSLLVISLQSAVGFVVHLRTTTINLHLAGPLIVLAIIASALGARLSQRFSSVHLRRGFAWLLLLLVVLMIVKQMM
jgi:uncharacterized membrane protein YfcA